MTVEIEQEAIALFVAELAAFLEEAIARLDALAPRPAQPHAKKPRKKKAAVDAPAGAEPQEAADAAAVPSNAA